MIHHHSSGKRGLWKRIFSMCIALVLICGVTVPASVSASGSADGADGVPAPETTYNFYLDGKEYASQTVKDGETLSEPETPTAEGKTFDAWYTEMEGGEKFTDFSVQTVTETKAVFLYGRWQEEDTADTENPEASEDTEIPESPETPEPGDPQELGEGEPGQQPNQEIENGETNTENQQPGTPETDEDGNTDSESDEDETAYEQRAMAVLALYGEEAAFRDGEAIGSEYFTVAGVPETSIPEPYTVRAGEITENAVPSITGYDFVNATVGDIEIAEVGILTVDEITYIYYTREGSTSDLVAMVLGTGEKIVLNYELHKDDYTIQYDVSGGSDVETVFGSDRPLTVEEGGQYAFRVTIPRGYEAAVKVNGIDQGKLGIEPEYYEEKDTNGEGTGVILADTSNGKPSELTLSGVYSISDVQNMQSVTVELNKRTEYQFSADLWVKTRYAADDEGPRADFNPTSCQIRNDGSYQKVWEFTTKENRIWILDSLQINGTKLNVPFGSYTNGSDVITAETELPSGTKVTIEMVVARGDVIDREWVWDGLLQGHWEYTYGDGTRTYRVYVSNCYEDITITGGNLFSTTTWEEIMVERLVGVKFGILAENGTTWNEFEQSEPFGVPQDNSNRDYTFERPLGFYLEPGYVDPVITYSTTAGGNDLGGLVSEVTGPYQDGWYRFSISGNNGNKFTLLRIEAKLGEYDVSYEEGKYAVSTDGTPDSLPGYDNGNYNIENKSQIIVSSQIPVDNTGKNVFTYWTLEGYEDENHNPIPIYPNQLLDVKEIALYAREENGVYILPLTANWADAGLAEQIPYTVQFILVDEEGNETVKKEETFQITRGGTVVINTDSEIIKQFLNEHPGYILAADNVRYYTGIQPYQEIPVYFVMEPRTDVTLTKDVTGGLGDVEKEFNFELWIGEQKQEFSLQDNGVKTFDDVKVGETLRFKETNADDYTVRVTYTDETYTDPEKPGTLNKDSDGFYEVTVKENLAIKVENHKAPDPDTGIHLTTWPYVMTLAFVGAGAVTFGLYKSRRRDS